MVQNSNFQQFVLEIIIFVIYFSFFLGLDSCTDVLAPQPTTNTGISPVESLFGKKNRISFGNFVVIEIFMILSIHLV